MVNVRKNDFIETGIQPNNATDCVKSRFFENAIQ